MPSEVKKVKTRQEQDPKFFWKLEDLCASNEAWNEDYKRISDGLEIFAGFKGRLGESKETLVECLTKRDELGEILERIYVYAHMRLHEDSNVSEYQAMTGKIDSLAVKFSSSLSFIDPEILSIGYEKIKSYCTDGFLYTHYFEDLFRLKDHVLSPELEELLAKSHEIGKAASDIYSMINDADIKFGTITDENGEQVEVTHGRYISLLECKDRRVRKDAFETLYESYIAQKNTLAATFGANVKSDWFFASARKFNSSLEAALSSNNIPTEVYRNLIDTVSKNLPTMHEYISLRKERLELPDIHMYDLYTPIVKEADTKINYDNAKETVFKALAVLGGDYVETIKSGLESGWIDVYENKGKRSGAYSWGAFGTHPYVLMNFDNKINDMFTLAHELGHAMHSYYSDGAQPYIYAGYPIFLAEVASTVNEALLMDYLLKTTTDKKQKEYLINYFMEQFRGTVFRQTMFAEFELLTHEQVEKGESLTYESLCDMYYGLNQKYYGNELISDEQIRAEWSRIPHFYRNYYVFQYATGFSASMALSQRILRNEPDAVKLYRGFLQSGSSDYAINILKKAGVDMSTPKPVQDGMDMFADLLKQMKAL